MTVGARRAASGPSGMLRPVPGRVLLLLAWAGLLVGRVAGWPRPGAIGLLLAFGVLVVVPLGLDRARRLGVHLVLRRSVPGGALLAAASLLLEPGVPATLLAVPWLVVSVLLALSGLSTFAAERSLSPRTLLPTAALGYLMVGAGWLVASRLGARPMGFADVIVELTAVHFHFAGFAAPLVAAATGEALQRRRLRRLAATAHWGGVGAVAAMPVVAAGFVFSAVLSAVGAVLLTVSLAAVAGAMVALATRPAAPPPHAAGRLLLLVAAGSVGGAMALAVVYAVAPLLGLRPPGIPAMAALHGTANAVGFCACGLAAFAAGDARPR